MYKIGDKVVYPHHGAGTVVKREKREVLGEKREYLTIKILHNDMTVNVPSENAEAVGLRKVIGEDMVNTAYDSPVDFPPKEQIEEAETRLFSLAETGKYGQGFATFEQFRQAAPHVPSTR